MEEKETICKFIMRIARLVNQVKTCGETITKHYVVAKILRSLAPKFVNVVVAIEKLKDLAMVSKEERHSSFEAHEQRMEERNIDKENSEIALQARFNERDKRTKGKWPMNKGRGNFLNFGGRES